MACLLCLGIARSIDAAPAPGALGRLTLDDGIEAVIRDGREIVLHVLPERGEGYLSLARRITGTSKTSAALQAANDGRALIENRPVVVPWDLIREEYRFLALRALFPKDRFRDNAWEHFPYAATATTYGEGLWQAALWFTGEGDNFREIAAFNRLEGLDLPRHEPLRIPRKLLLPLFISERTSSDGALTYKTDAAGDYAEYRLARGEAIYTAVLLRFTSVSPAELDDAAEEIIERSKIRNVRDLPVGFRVRIPMDMLLAEYLPRNHPRRLWAKIGADETAAVRLPTRPTSLSGVHVLLDPGHGGIDLGAQAHGIWESDYIYDIACRIKRRMEKETRATVHLLATSSKRGCRISNRKKLDILKPKSIATSPKHTLNSSRHTKMGVNLRWYLANAIYKRLRKGGTPPEKIVFISLHADALHASLRGGMAYIPGERYRRGTHSVRSWASRYKKYKEFKMQSKVSIPRHQRLSDEVVSRQLAHSILEAYRSMNLPVHKRQPIRDHVVRGRGKKRRNWLPAVLRGNQVPAKILLETVNLKNKKDAALLKSPDGREKLARAISQGLETFFDPE